MITTDAIQVGTPAVFSQTGADGVERLIFIASCVTVFVYAEFYVSAVDSTPTAITSPSNIDLASIIWLPMRSPAVLFLEAHEPVEPLFLAIVLPCVIS